MNYSNLKTSIASIIKNNGNKDITGNVLQGVLLSIVDSIRNGFLYAGIATPQTNPGMPDQNVFWVATEGTYTNFGTPIVEIGNGQIGIFSYNGTWTRDIITVVNISENINGHESDIVTAKAIKDFVNSSIATSTGTFVGTFNTIEELRAVENPRINSYGFVISTDGQGNTVYNRYKYVETGWSFEYSLNNSSFTAAQWAAINSGLTSTDRQNLLNCIQQLSDTVRVSAFQSHVNDTNIHTSLADKQRWDGKQDELTFDNVPTENSQNPVTSDGIYQYCANLENSISVTTQVLRNLITQKQLSPGKLYRITDYLPAFNESIGDGDTINIGRIHTFKRTFNGEESRFDILAIATSNDKISENAMACLHEGQSTYYAGSKLEAWCIKIAVSADDQRRPIWSDPSQIWIYYMTDEWENEAPYDFKNVIFDWNNTELENLDWIQAQPQKGLFTFSVLTGTVSSPVIEDGSLLGYIRNCKIVKSNYSDNYTYSNDGAISNIIIGRADSIIVKGEQNLTINLYTFAFEDSSSLPNTPEVLTGLNIIGSENRGKWTRPSYSGNKSTINGRSNNVEDCNCIFDGPCSQNTLKGYESTIHIGTNCSGLDLNARYTGITVGDKCENCTIEGNNITLGSHNSRITATDAENIVIGDNNLRCSILAPESQYFGKSQKVIIGNNNTNLELNYPRNVQIGDNNDSITFPNSDATNDHITIGNSNKSITLDICGYITIGNNNGGNNGTAAGTIRLQRCWRFKVGNYNKNISIEPVDITEGIPNNVTIGNCNETITCKGALQNSTIGNKNEDVEFGMNDSSWNNYYFDNIHMGDRNSVSIDGDDVSNIHIGNRNSITITGSTVTSLNFENNNEVNAESNMFYVNLGNNNNINIYNDSEIHKISLGDFNSVNFYFSCDTILIGKHNTAIRFYDDCSNVVIGDRNDQVNITDTQNVSIGNNNSNIGVESSSVIVIGNRNSQIEIYGDGGDKSVKDKSVNIGNDNGSITIEDSCYNINIGNRNFNVELSSMNPCEIENGCSNISLLPADESTCVVRSECTNIKTTESDSFGGLVFEEYCSNITFNNESSSGVKVLANTEGPKSGGVRKGLTISDDIRKAVIANKYNNNNNIAAVMIQPQKIGYYAWEYGGEDPDTYQECGTYTIQG